jgi:16S rRNA (guanine1207-N2)-methyltransferase
MPGAHYFDQEPSVPSRPRTVVLRLADLELSLTADRGVFAGRAPGIDPGTLTLLRQAPRPPAHGDLLDLGCGYGPIALALAARAPETTVWAIDINGRARQLAEANARTAGLANVRVAAPGEVPTEVRFTAIYSNPPVRIGNDALHELLTTWLSRLTADGAAWLVVQKHLGSDSLARWLGAAGWPTRRTASRQGYRVLEVRRGLEEGTVREAP